jgi:hypothetical protein
MFFSGCGFLVGSQLDLNLSLEIIQIIVRTILFGLQRIVKGVEG